MYRKGYLMKPAINRIRNIFQNWSENYKYFMGEKNNRIKILCDILKPGSKGKLLWFCFYIFVDLKKKSSKDIIDVSISELKQI